MWRKMRFWSGKPEPCHHAVVEELPKLTVALRQGEDGFIVAECMELPGCMSQGENEKEALKNIVDAIQACLAVHLNEFLRGSCELPHNLVGITAQESFQIKPPELELVGN